MIVTIEKNEIKDKVKAPSSKSYTHRALVCASLAEGRSRISSPLTSEDTEATLDILEKLGIRIKKKKQWEVTGNTFSKPKGSLL